uniref:non-specific serine/threonine protein kinase n=1 Tax=Glossina brevipalpis TaxID=37001 RepID=A0A1A9X0R7_9MUSC
MQNMDLGDPEIKPLKLLGSGAFGRVFLCNYRQEYKVCVKCIFVSNPKVHMKMVMEEIYIMSQLRHPHIVHFIRSYVHAGRVNIVMEYAPNGTLCDLIKRALPDGFLEKELMRHFCDILMGLEYLHIRNVIHRDLKPANLLVDSHFCIKISDFGVSLVSSPNVIHGTAGTLLYMAPEIMRGEKFVYKSDIWSLGCILYEMCCGCNPFSQATSTEELRRLIHSFTRQKIDCSAIRSKYCKMWSDICASMLITNVQDRISLRDILRCNANLSLHYYRKYFIYDC